jgi:hypothetical protein
MFHILCHRKIQNSRRKIITKIKQNKPITPVTVRRILPRNLLCHIDPLESESLLEEEEEECEDE